LAQREGELMNGRHPAIDFDARLHIGQVIEGRYLDPAKGDAQWIRTFRGRILRLGQLTARVGALESVGGWDAGHVFVLPRFASPLWSEHNGMFPYHGAAAVSEYKTEAGETISDLPTSFGPEEERKQRVRELQQFIADNSPEVQETKPADYFVENHGTIFLLRPANEQAKLNLEENAEEGAQWLGSALAVEHRYIRSLIERLESEGWEVSA
jgi:hypothetical protein